MPLKVPIPIEADGFENISKPELFHDLEIWSIRCKSNMNKGPIKEQLKEALANKVVVVGKEVEPANTNKKNPKFNSMIGQGFIETT